MNFVRIDAQPRRCLIHCEISGFGNQSADQELAGNFIGMPVIAGHRPGDVLVAITKMAKHLAGDKEALAGGKQIVPTRSLKKGDVASFQADLKKILGK